VIAINHNGTLYRPDHFLNFKGRADGIYSAKTTRDRYTAAVLNHEAKRENATFRSGRGESGITKFRIYWKDEKAVGYYFYSVPPKNQRKYPMLAQIFVKPEH
jgi:hypothetical protein